MRFCALSAAAATADRTGTTFSRLPGDVVVDRGPPVRDRGRGDSGRKARSVPFAPLVTGRHGPRTPPERAVALEATVDRADVAGDADVDAVGSAAGGGASPAASRSRADTLSRASASDAATRRAIFSAGVRGRDDEEDDAVSPLVGPVVMRRVGEESKMAANPVTRGDEWLVGAAVVGGVAEMALAAAALEVETGDVRGESGEGLGFGGTDSSADPPPPSAAIFSGSTVCALDGTASIAEAAATTGRIPRTRGRGDKGPRTGA